MKLSKNTINTLSGFAAINNSILFQEGQVQRVQAVDNSAIAEVTLEDSFPKLCAIYNIQQFLQTLGIFEDPEIEFEETFIKISSGKTTMRYAYTDPSNVVSRDSSIKLPSSDLEITIDGNDLGKVLKSANMFKCETVFIIGDGKNISLVSKEEDGSNQFSIEIAESDKEFVAAFPVVSFKLASGSYKVTICFKGVSQWESTTEKLTYWIPVDATKSEFNV